MKCETRAVGRPLPPDLEYSRAHEFVEDCGSCAYPFDVGERIYWSEALAEVFCSKACAADAWERREPVEAGEWIPIQD